MTLADLLRDAHPQPCAPFPRHVLSAEFWAAMGPLAATVDLMGMWADPLCVHALLHERGGDFALVSVPVEASAYPSLSAHWPAAAWFERMIHDLWGHNAAGSTEQRPWLDHGRWAIRAPLSLRPAPHAAGAEQQEFLAAEGEDIHQIPVGPVHAGIIEPGHFRFHAQGETVVRLEIRLGFLHKGTLAMMRGTTPRAAARFAARLSGDTTVAHSVAFAHAAEAACATAAPPRAVALRAVMTEMERIANHLGDCGAITNDASFAFLPARFGFHREQMLRAAARMFGHRLMMDAVIPGGVAVDLATPDPVLAALAGVEAEMGNLLRVYDDSASLADRMVTTGIVEPDLAARFAAGGPIGRASGRGFDCRVTPGYAPYDTLAPAVPVLTEGDVDARVRIRIAEIVESTRMIRHLLTTLPDGPLAVQLPMVSAEGLGWAEGFRGDIWHWLRLEGGLISAVFMRDPSWLQWPLLQSAIRGNIVADFPLCNKSFNCSYSGVDL
jgi:Ni,Fe-hydrogenase III large subunit